jgi:hypothetical protein
LMFVFNLKSGGAFHFELGLGLGIRDPLTFALSIGVVDVPGSGFSVPDPVPSRRIEWAVERESLDSPPASSASCDVAGLIAAPFGSTGDPRASFVRGTVGGCSGVTT